MNRTITTVEELDALPAGTVMRARTGELCETGTIPSSNEPCVWSTGWLDHTGTIEHLAPLTVLYVPGKQPRPLPDREQIARAMEQVLIESVGECTCDEAYTAWNLNDPDCLWHNANPRGEFPGDAADAVLALFR